MPLDLIFPPRCALCGAALAMGEGLCAACWSSLALPGEPACQLCQRPLPSEAKSHHAEHMLCAPCVEKPPLHKGVAAATLYNDTSRRMVIAFKYGRKVALARLMGRMMAARAKARGVGEGWLLVPVPLHRWRLWGRGFNQSALLARELAQQIGASALVDGLHRLRPTRKLGGLGAEERARVMTGVIGVHPRRAKALQGARVLLVDDVLTSGATTDACIHALHSAGVAEVVVACFARVDGGTLA
ncbi:ComF family protein [Novosphingobium umbonatum]|uniref:ComF family protein n=1 Tax=Novosphingobium umbonatum TaxID=1908524 RepID=A0A3S2UTX0_9SPHN|nr:ComF family protein [Novosphingobium umbonatum]RVU06218.1 ComF family protein [Novosphingobium umbonatum]